MSRAMGAGRRRAGGWILISGHRGSATGSTHPGLAAAVRPEPAEQLDQADNDQAEDPPADPPARNAAQGHSTASGSELVPKRKAGGTPRRGGSRPAAGIVFTGSGDGIVQLKNVPGPAAVRISGNQTSNHFKVRALGTQDVVVVTTGPYQGVRPLDWDGGNWTGFEVTTTGPWRIEVMPLSVIPTSTSRSRAREIKSSPPPATVQSPISPPTTTDGSFNVVHVEPDNGESPLHFQPTPRLWARPTRDHNSSIYTPRARGPFRSRIVLAPVPRIGPAWPAAAAIMNEAVAIRVFVIKDDEVVRRGLCDLLDSVPWVFRSPPVGGRSGDVNRLSRCRGPSPRSCLGDRAVAGVALGGGEVGRRVGAGAAAEAVGARPAGEHVVAAHPDQPVVTSAAGQVSLPAAAGQGVVPLPPHSRS